MTTELHTPQSSIGISPSVSKIARALSAYCRSPLHISFLTLLIFIALRTLSAPQVEFGDGREYVLQTQAIVFDRALQVDPLGRADYFNRTNPFGIKLDPHNAHSIEQDAKGEGRMLGGNFGALYLSSDGSYRYIHSWVYSMVVAPVYALLHYLDRSSSSEYQAFRLVNICFLFGTFLLAGWLS